MSDLFTERNFDDKSTYYQIDIMMSEGTVKYLDIVTDVICEYCDLPMWYGKKIVKSRLLLSCKMEKAITIDCGSNYNVCFAIFKLLTKYCSMFMRDNYYKRKEPTYKAKRRY